VLKQRSARAAGPELLEFVAVRDHTLAHAFGRILFDVLEHEGTPAAGVRRLGRDQGADVLAARGAHERPRFVEVEDTQGQPVIAAHHDRRGVHHAQALVEHLVVLQPLESPRLGFLTGPES
jgi:hypothetical protein